jgi:hypothetical protein
MMKVRGNGLSLLSETGRAAREDADALKAKKADLQFVEEKKLQVIARRRRSDLRSSTARPWASAH